MTTDNMTVDEVDEYIRECEVVFATVLANLIKAWCLKDRLLREQDDGS